MKDDRAGISHRQRLSVTSNLRSLINSQTDSLFAQFVCPFAHSLAACPSYASGTGL